MRIKLSLLAICVLMLPAPALAQQFEALPFAPMVEAEPEPVLQYEMPECWEDCFSFRVEYLYWYLKRLGVPPLLTTGPVGASGILGEPGTVVLRGEEPLRSRHDRYIGVRGRLEWWLPQTRTVGLQTDFFFLERDSSYFTIDHGTYPVLAVPYVDAATGQARSYLVGGNDPARGNLSGGAVVYSRIELFGQEANVLVNLIRQPQWEVNLIGGVRFLQSRERLNLTSTSIGPPNGSALYGLEDKFNAFNKFYGGQIGLEARAYFGRWFVEGKAAAALGGNDELVRAVGERITHFPDQRTAEPYGLFVLPSNQGEHRRWDFDAVGDFRINIGFQLTRHISVLAGYTLLLWDGPVRPGDQVQPVDLSQLTSPGGARQPQVQFVDSFFWAQGLNVGVHLHW